MEKIIACVGGKVTVWCQDHSQRGKKAMGPEKKTPIPRGVGPTFRVMEMIYRVPLSRDVCVCIFRQEIPLQAYFILSKEAAE